MKGRSVGILLIVLMLLIGGALFVVVGVCAGAHAAGQESFGKRSAAHLATQLGLAVVRGDNGGHPDWRRTIPTWTLIAAAGLCLWLLVCVM
jgi:hypothetical protein